MNKTVLCFAAFIFFSTTPYAVEAQFLDGVESITVSAPVSKTHDVTICYGTVTGETECDYEQPSLSELTVPFWGQITYRWRIVPNIESRASFEVINAKKKCRLHLKGETFMRNTRIMGNGNVLSWDIAEASLGDGAKCFSDGDPLSIRTVITLTVESENNGRYPVTVTLTNLPKPDPGSNTYRMDTMTVRTAD